jgi:CheY-like chemotaxis protein
VPPVARKPWGSCAAEAGHPYDLALLDVQMPEMDGLTLARAIKGDRTLAVTRLIVLTSFGQAFNSAELKNANIEAYLVKPVKQSRPFDCLASVMGKAMAENAVLKLAPPAPAAINLKPGLPLEKMRMTLFSWIVRCLRWMGTKRHRPYAKRSRIWSAPVLGMRRSTS